MDIIETPGQKPVLVSRESIGFHTVVKDIQYATAVHWDRTNNKYYEDFFSINLKDGTVEHGWHCFFAGDLPFFTDEIRSNIK